VDEICALIKSLDLRYDGQLLGKITVSAGIAAAPDHAFTAGNLLRAADECLYAAKEAGRDQVVVCEAPVESNHPGGIHNASQSKDDAPLPKD
jgi:diguanylate cyclase (GGDEF)-like protein